MGSMGSRPKVASAPQVQYIYVPAAPAYTPPLEQQPAATVNANATPQTPAISTADSGGNNTAAAKGDSENERASGLLDRKRGVASTVLTGFRGILNDSAKPGQRKTLLGE